ncbi:MAG: hypothetical protein R6X21_11545, partial [Candidatus Aminicenantes bacterium]
YVSNLLGFPFQPFRTFATTLPAAARGRSQERIAGSSAHSSARMSQAPRSAASSVGTSPAGSTNGAMSASRDGAVSSWARR